MSVPTAICGSASSVIWKGEDFGSCFHAVFINVGLLALFSLYAFLRITFSAQRKSAHPNGYVQLSRQDYLPEEDEDAVDDETDIDPIKKRTGFDIHKLILFFLLLVLCTVQLVHLGDTATEYFQLLPPFATIVVVFAMFIGLVYRLAKPETQLSVTIRSLIHQFSLLYLILSVLDFYSILLDTKFDWHAFSLRLIGAQLLLAIVFFLLVVMTRPFQQMLSPEGRLYTLEYGQSIFQAINISWLNKLLWLGYQRQLRDEDLWELLPRDRAENVLKLYREFYNNSFFWTMVRTVRTQLFWQAFFTTGRCCFMFFSPFFLGRILQYIQHPESRGSIWEAYFNVIGMAIGSICNSAFNQQAYLLGRHISVNVNAIISGEVYRKSLRRAMVMGRTESKDGEEPGELQEASGVGEVTNLLQVDQSKISSLSAYLCELYSLPIQIVVAIVFLMNLMGLSTFFAVGGLLMMYPITVYLGKQFDKIQDEVLRATDKRLNLINEMLQGVRIVKLFAWEEPMRERIQIARERELHSLWRRLLNYFHYIMLSYANPLIVLVFMFGAHSKILHRELDAATVFTALSLANMLRHPMEQLPDMILWAIQCMVSVRRVSKYLDGPEIDPGILGDTDIGFQKAEFRWETASVATEERASVISGFSLKGLNFNFPTGEMTVIAGPTGSGKTSLLMALLGEMPRVRGRTFLPRRAGKGSFRIQTTDIAYVAQTAWLQNASIRDNILFGKPFDQVRYDKTIKCCALVTDFEILEAGDSTEVGEKGITLSGGQKQRVALARAVYSDAKHVLLDDCLSAVDAHTAKHLYENCLMGELMYGRTRVLVTHHVGMCLPGSSYFVQLNQGQVTLHGKTEELMSQGLLESYLKAHGNSHVEKKDKKEDGEDDEEEEEKAEKKTASGKLTEAETRAVGKVKFAVYDLYLKASGGYLWWIGLIAAYVIAQIGSTSQTYWLRIWSSSYDSGEPVDVGYYLGVYVLLGIASISVVSFRVYVMFAGSIRASRYLHQRLLNRIMYAKVRFFDTTPLGRIMNRFSRDIEAMDQELSSSLSFMLYAVMETIGVVLVITWVTPLFLFPGILVSYLFVRIMLYYLAGSRDMKRLESVARSPVLTHFGETVNGVCTIRAFGAEDRFMRENVIRVDGANRPYYLLWAANRWLSWRVDLSGSMVTFFAGLFIILNVDSLDAGIAGFSMSYAMTFTDTVLWVVRMYSEVEMNMNSIERLQEYLEVEQEPPAIIPNNRPASNWPNKGEITVENLSIRYSADKQPVLNNVNFHIKPGSRVGVVGRTGAGKSTLAISFFRFIEANNGRIVIDGIDISKIGLRDLRGKLTIIPQDPVLFTGTIRSNLDPFDECTDEAIWSALRQSSIIGDLNEPRPSGLESLDAPIAENGSNFSQGQRQLLAMSRALLRSSKLIIMDEATASVDFETDEKIQRTIREGFSEATLLCIAHRLRTVIDYDMVLVMDAGMVAEYDRPWQLLQRKDGIFRSMCERSGDFKTLWEMARKKEEETAHLF